MDNKKTTKVLLMVLGILLVLGGVTYAYFQVILEGQKEHSINTGEVTFTYTESNAVTIEGAKPMTDSEGSTNGGEFAFSVSAKSTTSNDIKYVVYLTDSVNSTINNHYVRTELFDDDNNILRDVVSIGAMDSYEDVSNSHILYYNEFNLTGEETGDKQHNYVLRFWLDEDYNDKVSYTQNGNSTVATAGGNSYTFKVNVATVSKTYDTSKKELSKLIMAQGVVTSGDGLYMSTATNDGSPTYYYHGNVENNYVNLAGVGNDSAFGKVGLCQYNNNVIVNQNQVPANESECLNTTGLCYIDGLYITGFDEATCQSVGDEYISEVPTGEINICSYDKAPIANYTETGVMLVEQSQCSSITNLCDVTSTLGGYINGVDQSFCEETMGGSYISAAPTFGIANGFSGMLWRIVRINEDGTIRLISDEGQYQSAFNPNYDNYKYMYYSESNVEGGIKKTLNDWYDANLKDYDSKIATGSYCEEAYDRNVFFPNDATFKCELDANGYGPITDQKIGLINCGELVYGLNLAVSGMDGEYFNGYLSNMSYWTMCPAKFVSEARVFSYYYFPDASLGGVTYKRVDYSSNDFGLLYARPVINLYKDTIVTGNGTKESPFVITK